MNQLDRALITFYSEDQNNEQRCLYVFIDCADKLINIFGDWECDHPTSSEYDYLEVFFGFCIWNLFLKKNDFFPYVSLIWMTYRSVFVDTGENYYTCSCYFNVANYSVANDVSLLRRLQKKVMLEKAHTDFHISVFICYRCISQFLTTFNYID